MNQLLMILRTKPIVGSEQIKVKDTFKIEAISLVF